MRIASIDIGTNTILLLIADVDLSTKSLLTLHEEISMPRIGKDLNRTGFILEEKIDELEKILFEFKRITDKYDCEKCFIIGTHALRQAINRNEIVERIIKNTGMRIEIVPPDLEAEYAFYGVLTAVNTDDTFAIVDIGGGSSEIIIGKQKKLLEKISIPIGVVTLKDNFISAYPISFEEKQILHTQIEEAIRKLKLKKYAPKSIIGISGTPTTLSAIIKDLKIFDVKQIDGSILPLKKIQLIVEFLGNSSIDKIKNKYGDIITKREDILYVGGRILIEIMNYFELAETIVSTKGIRHGVIYKKLLIDK